MSVESASFLMLGWVIMVTVLNFLISIWILKREIQIKTEVMEFISVLIEDWREEARRR